MTDKEFLEKLIDINQPMTTNPVRFSTIGILLRAARKLFGRDLETGEYKGNELNMENIVQGTYFPNQFSGIINYLIFLEQLGSVFKLKESNSTEINPIYRVLENFSDLAEEKKYAIVALRNSLAHKFGLATKKDASKKLRHKFTLSIEKNSEIVQLPTVSWTGDFSDKSEESNTVVYTINLTDLIETIYNKLKEDLSNSKIEPSLDINELKGRFTFTL